MFAVFLLCRNRGSLGCRTAQQQLEIYEGQLNRVEIGTVGRQVVQRRSRGLDRLAHAGDIVGDQVVNVGGLKTDQVRRMKDLEVENARLRKAIADLTLDKLIL